MSKFVLIMRKLNRPPKPGRAGVVVPNGTLFGDGVCARIKEELLGHKVHGFLESYFAIERLFCGNDIFFGDIHIFEDTF